MALDTWEEVVVKTWATFPCTMAYDREPCIIAAAYFVEDYGNGRRQPVVRFSYRNELDVDVEFDPFDDFDLELRVSLFTRAVRRLIPKRTTRVRLGHGRLSRLPDNDEIQYTAGCGERFNMELNDLLILAEWLEEE